MRKREYLAFMKRLTKMKLEKTIVRAPAVIYELCDRLDPAFLGKYCIYDSTTGDEWGDLAVERLVAITALLLHECKGEFATIYLSVEKNMFHMALECDALRESEELYLQLYSHAQMSDFSLKLEDNRCTIAAKLINTEVFRSFSPKPIIPLSDIVQRTLDEIMVFFENNDLQNPSQS